MKLPTLLRNANLQRFGACLILAGVALLYLGPLANTANFTLFGFTANLIKTRELLYPSAVVPVSTYPLGPLLLAAIGSNRSQLLVGAWLVGALATATGAMALSTLTERPWLVAVTFVFISAASPSLVVLVMLALVLTGITAARRDRWQWAGILLGFAILTEPSAIFPALLLALLSFRERDNFWQYALPVLLIPFAGLGLLELTLQPSTGMQAVPVVSIVPSIFTVALPVLALWRLMHNWSGLQEYPFRAVLVSWSGFAALVGLLHGTWPSFALIPGVLVLAVAVPGRSLLILAVAVDLLLNIALPETQNVDAERSLGLWIASNTPAESTLATASIGALAYFANRPVIDLSGQLQSVPFDREFFLRTAPDTIVLGDAIAAPWDGFKTTYARQFASGGKTIYRRVVNFTPLEPLELVERVYGGNLNRSDLRLDSFAVARSAHPGDLVRVRLDWQLAYTPNHEIDITLSLIDSAGKQTTVSFDKFMAENWHTGNVTTYHALALPNTTPVGSLTLKLSVTYANGDLGAQDIATVTVAKPPAP